MGNEVRVSALAKFDNHLDELEQRGHRRCLSPREGCDFTSNDYLGLANSSELKSAVANALSRNVPVGSGGSRLLRGNQFEHEALEEEAAHFFGSESSLFFSTGYGANSALLSTLPQRQDLILHDELIHASSREGMRLSRARATAARHNDSQSFADQLRRWRKNGGMGHPWIVVESLYSMDGDRAPLNELWGLADEFDGFLVIDEAHATGVFGDRGRGLAGAFEGRANVVTIRTCGKALGCEGALVCGPRTIRDFLINRGRGFIFSTAPSPLMAAAVRSALQILKDDGGRQQKLHSLFEYAAGCLEPVGARYHNSQILALIVGSAEATMRIASKLQRVGFDVRGIRPPTVPDGTSRIRISITLNVDEASIAALARAIRESLG